MRLFFETASQAGSFLASIPLGFAAALCLDVGDGGGIMRMLLDLLWFLICGMSLLVLTFLIHDAQIRLYHVLGLISGALLYLRGISAVRKAAAKKYEFWKKSRCRQEKNSHEAK